MLNVNNQQLDMLSEVINIASGNAATSLSKLLNKTINMTCPNVSVCKFDDVATGFGNEEDIVVATLLKVIGDVSGSILMVVKNEDAEFIATELLADMYDYQPCNEEMALSVIQEIGNILGNSYLRAMGEFLQCNMLSSIPYLSVDMILPILTSSYVDANQIDDYIIDARCTLYKEDVEFKLSIFFIISPESISKMIDRATNLYLN